MSILALLALRDGSRLYAIDEHFKRIGDLAGLARYEPGYGGMFRPE